jgi:hypothetical protein
MEPANHVEVKWPINMGTPQAVEVFNRSANPARMFTFLALRLVVDRLAKIDRGQSFLDRILLRSSSTSSSARIAAASHDFVFSKARISVSTAGSRNFCRAQPGRPGRPERPKSDFSFGSDLAPINGGNPKRSVTEKVIEDAAPSAPG